MKRFRGGLVFEAHRLLYYSTLGLRVIQKEKRPARKSRERSIQNLNPECARGRFERPKRSKLFTLDKVVARDKVVDFGGIVVLSWRASAPGTWRLWGNSGQLKWSKLFTLEATWLTCGGVVDFGETSWRAGALGTWRLWAPQSNHPQLKPKVVTLEALTSKKLLVIF